MTSLIPRDHFFQDLYGFRRDFDQIFNRFLSRPSAQEESAMTTAGENFHGQVMSPGVDYTSRPCRETCDRVGQTLPL